MQDAWAPQLDGRRIRILVGNPQVAVAVGSDETGWKYEMVDRDDLPRDNRGVVAFLDEILQRLVKEDT